MPDGKEGSGLVIGKSKCGDCVFSVVLGDATVFPKEDGHKTEAALSPFWPVGITHAEEVVDASSECLSKSECPGARQIPSRKTR